MITDKEVAVAMDNEFDGYPFDCLVKEVLELRAKIVELKAKTKQLVECPECKSIDSEQCICAGTGTIIGAYYMLKGRISRTYN